MANIEDFQRRLEKTNTSDCSEFKFEPSAKRADICTHKLPMVFWNAVIAGRIFYLKPYLSISTIWLSF